MTEVETAHPEAPAPKKAKTGGKSSAMKAITEKTRKVVKAPKKTKEPKPPSAKKPKDPNVAPKKPKDPNAAPKAPKKPKDPNAAPKKPKVPKPAGMPKTSKKAGFVMPKNTKSAQRQKDRDERRAVLTEKFGSVALARLTDSNFSRIANRTEVLRLNGREQLFTRCRKLTWRLTEDLVTKALAIMDGGRKTIGAEDMVLATRFMGRATFVSTKGVGKKKPAAENANKKTDAIERNKTDRKKAHMASAFNAGQFRRLVNEILEKGGHQGIRVGSAALPVARVFVERTLSAIFNYAALNSAISKRHSVDIKGFNVAAVGLLHPEALFGTGFAIDSIASVDGPVMAPIKERKKKTKAEPNAPVIEETEAADDADSEVDD